MALPTTTVRRAFGRGVPAACAAGLLALAALGATAPAATAVLRRGPYLQLLTTTSVTIVWDTDTAAACSLEIRPLSGAVTVVEGAAGTGCVMPVTGLAPGTEYAYTPRADGVALTRESVFRTDGGQGRFSFLVLGDSGTGGAQQAVVRDAMLGTPADFILHTGDVVYDDGARADFDPNFFVPYAQLLRRLVLWPSLGNHDVHTEDGAPWREAFHTPANNPAGSEEYYSFDFGTAHVAVIDSNDSTDPGSPQHTFLDQDLASSTQPWKFVMFHHSIYSSGRHGSDEGTREDLVPLFDRHGVDAVFMGHDHDYERTVLLEAGAPAAPGRGTLYVTTGGGGAELRAVGRSEFTAYAEAVFHFTRVVVDDGWLLVQMIREDGVVRDSWVLERGAAPPPPVCGDGVVNQPSEQCDGADEAACPTGCGADCTCPPVCGDGRRNQAAEECDRGDDAACPGLCLAACRCGAPERFVSFAPVADTYIEGDDQATWDHGAAEELDVDDRPSAIAYLKFDLGGLTAPARAATLTLHCTNESPDGGTLYAIADSSWVEGDRTGEDETSAGGPGLTWSQVDTSGDDAVDAKDTSPWAPNLRRWVTTLGPVEEGRTHAIDVTAALEPGRRLYTFAIKNNDDDGARFVSREYPDPARRPRLRLELATGPACDASCDDGRVCTVDRCDPAGGCTHTPVPGCCAAAADCDDGDPCTGTETCEPRTGQCHPGAPPACDDGVVCTRDRCDPVAGCTHEQVAGCCRRDADCDDASRCSGQEACDTASGLCRPGTALVCDDGDACTGTETCEAATGCAPGLPLACDDGDRCTTDGCDPAAGCTHVALAGAAGADCALVTLHMADLCAPVPLDPGLRRAMGKRVTRARVLLDRAGAAAPEVARRLLRRADRQLQGIHRQARKHATRGRITEACRARLEQAVEVPRALLRELAGD